MIPRWERGLWMLIVSALLLGFIATGDPGQQQLQAGNGIVLSDGTIVDPTGTTTLDPNQPAGPVSTQGPGQSVDTEVPVTRAEKRADLLACSKGENGGSTDRGVTEDKIRLATTAVLDGAAGSLLKDSLTGMQAVINRVNREGGICGRILDLTVRNDSFRADLGQTYIRNFIEDEIFALAVVPSAEGLGAAILSKDISRAGIPVVGTDGMRVEQYRDPWVWPVATATVSTMRAMADFAYRERGARTFAIVWDSKYKFGAEGSAAFKDQVSKLGGTLVTEAKLDPDISNYASEVQNWNGKCGDRACDMVALLLLPDTATTWMKSLPEFGFKYTAGAQTLFTDKFAQDCAQLIGDACQGVAAWTGFNPPVGRFKTLPGVATYVNEVKAISPKIATANQFLQGAYLGMSVLVEALKQVGPNLTRARLKTVLDSMNYKTDLSSTLGWRPDNHAANISARGFSMVIQAGTFRSWRDDNTGFREDPAGGP